jgi:hypothetical protein
VTHTNTGQHGDLVLTGLGRLTGGSQYDLLAPCPAHSLSS